jgi:zinc protease
MVCLPVGAVAEEVFFSWDPIFVEKLPNGMLIIVKEDHTAPLAVADVWFRVGSRNESERTNGIAHFLEHTLFKGTKTRGVGEITREIESFGGKTNAGTSMDFTHYYISCESRHILKALEIHADVFQNSLLAAEAVDSERPVILDEIKRGEDNPQRVLWNALVESAFPNHPYGRRTIGPRENVALGITPEDMKTFFRTWYGPANMTLVVTGAVDTQAVVARIKELYKDFSGEKPPVVELAKEPEPKEPVFIRREMDVKKSYLLMGYRTVASPNAKETVGLDVLGVVLGQGRTSRLSLALKEKSGLTTQISAGQLSMIDDGLFLIRAEFDPVDEEEVLAGIRSEIRSLVREQVKPDELTKARDFLENLYVRAVESNEGKAEALGMAIVKSNLESEKEYLRQVRAVTSSELQILANKYLSQDEAVTVVVSPRAQYQSVGAMGEVVKYLLPNGLRVLHRPIPNSGLVGVSLAVDAGNRREEPGKSGVSNLTAQTLLKGTRKRDSQKLLWDLEALGGELVPSAEPDLLRFNLGISRRNFTPGMRLLAEVVASPAFPEAEFAQEKKLVLKALRGISDDMFGNTWRLFHEAMFVGHPYGIHPLGNAQDVEKLDRNEVVEFHRQWFRPENMVVAVVGDISASETLKVVCESFGAVRAVASETTHATRSLSIPVAPGEAKSVIDRKEREQVMLCLGWLGPAIGHADFEGMKVLNAVLGGGMSARYFTKIRNQKGLAYAASGVFPSRMDGGPLCAIIGTDPGSVEKVRDLVLAEVAAIRDQGISQEELDRAISFVTGQFALEHGTCLKAASYLSWFETIGVGFDYDQKYLDRVRAVTADDIRRLAGIYLHPGKSLLAVTGSPADQERH